VWRGAVVSADASSARSACQYRVVDMLLASTTSPLEPVTLCLVEVGLFVFAEAASPMIGVPRPARKTGSSMGADLS
jgi:hypothetical protein